MNRQLHQDNEAIYDNNFKALKEGSTNLVRRDTRLTDIPQEEIDVVKNGTTGNFAIRSRIFYEDDVDKWYSAKKVKGIVTEEDCYELPSLKQTGERGFHATKPGFFREWKRVDDPTSFGPHHLKVYAGKITTYQSHIQRETTLPITNVTTAIWVPKN